MRILTATAALLAAILCLGQTPAWAQGLTGQWEYNGCRLTLDTLGPLNYGRAETNFCSGEWAFVTQWRPSQSGVQLMNPVNRVLVNLNYDGRRLFLTSNTGTAVVFRRTGQGGVAQMGPMGIPGFSIPNPFAPPQQPRQQNQGCIRHGQTDTCAQRTEIAVPNTVPRNAPADGRTAQGQIVMRVNYRAGPSLNAPIHFQLQPGTCFTISACQDAPDGPWCRTRINGRDGYVTKIVNLNGNRAITFTNGCPRR